MLLRHDSIGARRKLLAVGDELPEQVSTGSLPENRRGGMRRRLVVASPMGVDERSRSSAPWGTLPGGCIDSGPVGLQQTGDGFRGGRLQMGLGTLSCRCRDSGLNRGVTPDAVPEDRKDRRGLRAGGRTPSPLRPEQPVRQSSGDGQEGSRSGESRGLGLPGWGQGIRFEPHSPRGIDVG